MVTILFLYEQIFQQACLYVFMMFEYSNNEVVVVAYSKTRFKKITAYYYITISFKIIDCMGAREKNGEWHAYNIFALSVLNGTSVLILDYHMPTSSSVSTNSSAHEPPNELTDEHIGELGELQQETLKQAGPWYPSTRIQNQRTSLTGHQDCRFF